MRLNQLYGCSLALSTDLYQLTMAYGYWKLGMADRRAAFHLTFRRHPFQGGYTIAAGLAFVLDFLEQFRYAPDDVQYLAELTGNDGQPLFEAGFLDYLAQLEFACDVDAMPEGTVVFPHEPLIRVTGPLLQGQLLETPLLSLINFQTLVATKAARVCQAAGDDAVLEFGLRRAQGLDGAMSASRAAFIGGCAASSNVLAGKLLGIPVRGTHAHSWVMAFADESSAFEAYADAMPNNCVFLVDTYDTLQGVHRAIEVGRQLKQRGHKMVGVRLDSGDLAYLSIEARKLLDEAGFEDAVIVASNDLDEQVIASLKEQGARIAVWGVGTRLVTAHDDPALGGVYKLTALQDTEGQWQHTIKLSEQAIKVSDPGILQVRRFRRQNNAVADMIYDELAPATETMTIVDPVDSTRRRRLAVELDFEDVLVPVVRNGSTVFQAPSLVDIRQRAADQLCMFHEGIRRQLHPHEYPVGLEEQLYERKMKLILEARQEHGDPASGDD